MSDANRRRALNFEIANLQKRHENLRHYHAENFMPIVRNNYVSAVRGAQDRLKELQSRQYQLSELRRTSRNANERDQLKHDIETTKQGVETWKHNLQQRQQKLQIYDNNQRKNEAEQRNLAQQCAERVRALNMHR